MDNKTIGVLLSTYNGEKYLKEQIESVLAQKNVKIKLYIRDDGSTDRTVQICNKYQNTHQNVVLIQGNNIGCSQSFFSLICRIKSENLSYIAFCDQDDIWLPNKLYTAIECLKPYSNEPALYCSNLNVVDENMNYLRAMYSKTTKPCKTLSLLENIATGCTCVANNQLINLLHDRGLPQKVIMHDWWLYCMASFWGTVIFDKKSYINYRQHSNNVLGARTNNVFYKLSNFIKSCINNQEEHYREEQAKLFLTLNLPYYSADDLKLVLQIANYRSSFVSRLKLAFNINLLPDFNLRLIARILFGLI